MAAVAVLYDLNGPREPAHLIDASTQRPSHFSRNLKFFQGSTLCGFTANSAMTMLSLHG
jgi:hypothetical protein